MGVNLCKCCCLSKRNAADSDSRELKILLLGLENVGKTEIGCVLAGKRRTTHNSTNDVQVFEVKMARCSLSITEVDGKRKTQKLWHNYYSRTMGLIFCYDMSIGLRELENTFQLLDKIASHKFMRGKAILLIGTKSDLVSDTIQLYDIENRFAVEDTANKYFSNLKSIHFNPSELQNLWNGIEWLAANILIDYKNLNHRIENDNKIEKWIKKRNSPIKKLNLSYRRHRPKTAPANINANYTSRPCTLSEKY